MPSTLPANTRTFDVMVWIAPRFATGRRKEFRGGQYVWHETRRSSAAGAVAASTRYLNGRLEREMLRRVSVQPCGDDGTCWKTGEEIDDGETE